MYCWESGSVTSVLELVSYQHLTLIPTNMSTLDYNTEPTQSLSHPVHLITDCTHLLPIIVFLYRLWLLNG